MRTVKKKKKTENSCKDCYRWWNPPFYVAFVWHTGCGEKRLRISFLKFRPWSPVVTRVLVLLEMTALSEADGQSVKVTTPPLSSKIYRCYYKLLNFSLYFRHILPQIESPWTTKKINFLSLHVSVLLSSAANNWSHHLRRLFFTAVVGWLLESSSCTLHTLL